MKALVMIWPSSGPCSRGARAAARSLPGVPPERSRQAVCARCPRGCSAYMAATPWLRSSCFDGPQVDARFGALWGYSWAFFSLLCGVYLLTQRRRRRPVET